MASGTAPPAAREAAIGRRTALTSTLPAALLAAAMTLVANVLDWRGADAPAYLFRIARFRQVGFAVWNTAWYGGHHTLSYSALLAPIGALVGPSAVWLTATVVGAAAFDRLIGGLGVIGARRRAATLLFAAGTVTNVAVGRLAFALGLAAGLLAALAGQRSRWWLAAVLSLATSLASPVAGCFLAIGWAATVIARPGRRNRLAPCWCIAAAGAPIAVFAIAFPEGGTFPFRFASLVVVLLTCALLLVVVPARHRELRIGTALYALVALGAFVVATPLGGNVVRLGMFVTAPIIVAVGASSRRYLVLVTLPLLLWWQWSPAIDGMARAARDPSTDQAYYTPLVDYLQQQPSPVSRVEVAFTKRHYEAAFVAPVVPLARGWERQLDMLDNPEFYAGPLDATTYQRWLVSNGVQLVALPDAPLDPSAEAEAAVIASGPSYLQPVWHDDHWRVWRVVGSPGLTSGGAELVARRGDQMTFEATSPGPVLVRVRWTRFWSLTGAGCVQPATDGWTRIDVRSPGTFTLQPAVRGERQHCDDASVAGHPAASP
jgi:hypothetical protein